MSKRILIVDDAASMRILLKDILVRNSFSIAGEAYDGLQAVEKYISTKPDLVLMDIAMPNMNGIQALTEIKKIDDGAKVVMCSIMGQKSIVIESIRAGAIDFIVKPFHADRIIQVLNRIL